jgi:hypothetical protein
MILAFLENRDRHTAPGTKLIGNHRFGKIARSRGAIYRGGD